LQNYNLAYILGIKNIFTCIWTFIGY